MKSKNYKRAAEKIDKKKTYSIAEAVKLVKETSRVKFDASVEVHMRLGIDSKKGDQLVRGNVVLPHGTGKTKKVAVFTLKEAEAKKAGADIVGGEELIKQIKTTGKIDFDIALASPEIMRSLAQVAKVLGPKGLMPAPKSGTVVKDSEMAKAVEEIKKGKVSFRNDDTANIHQVIGKVSWEDSKLVDNFSVLLDAINKAKPNGTKGVYLQSVYLTSSMGPSVRVEV